MEEIYPICNDLTKVPSLFKEYGVCVIPNVFSDLECDTWMKDILHSMEKISDNQVNHNFPEEWSGNKLPIPVKYGCYQHVFNNLRPVWEIRRDPRLKEIFGAVYSELRGKRVDEFVCSLDGINIQPNVKRDDISKDKMSPHCDQRGYDIFNELDDIFKCVQGQVVLTNTTASFVATPKSHKHFIKVMDAAGIPNLKPSHQGVRFDDHQIQNIMKHVLLPNGIHFQVPIKAPKGSVIIWFSTTIHSAISSSVKEASTKDDPFKGWRGVVYVCYRPKSEFNSAQLKTLKYCLKRNRGTNHWATRVFPLTRKRQIQKLSPMIRKVAEKPELVYDILRFKPHKSSFLINEKISMNVYEEEAESTVFVSNLDFATTEQHLTDFFSKSGTIKELRLVKNYAGKSRGFAYVMYPSSNEATHALNRDKELLCGRPAYVSKYEAAKC